jgi:hypothetical protein
MGMLRADDVLLVLAENPAAIVRLVQRRLQQDPTNRPAGIGTARAS